MHAADALHGDLGMVEKEDIVLCLSKSGETEEFKVLVPILKLAGNTLIAMVANKILIWPAVQILFYRRLYLMKHALTTWYLLPVQQPKWSWEMPLLFVC